MTDINKLNHIVSPTACELCGNNDNVLLINGTKELCANCGAEEDRHRIWCCNNTDCVVCSGGIDDGTTDIPF